MMNDDAFDELLRGTANTARPSFPLDPAWERLAKDLDKPRRRVAAWVWSSFGLAFLAILTWLFMPAQQLTALPIPLSERPVAAVFPAEETMRTAQHAAGLAVNALDEKATSKGGELMDSTQKVAPVGDTPLVGNVLENLDDVTLLTAEENSPLPAQSHAADLRAALLDAEEVLTDRPGLAKQDDGWAVKQLTEEVEVTENSLFPADPKASSTEADREKVTASPTEGDIAFAHVEEDASDSRAQNERNVKRSDAAQADEEKASAAKTPQLEEEIVEVAEHESELEVIPASTKDRKTLRPEIQLDGGFLRGLGAAADQVYFVPKGFGRLGFGLGRHYKGLDLRALLTYSYRSIQTNSPNDPGTALALSNYLNAAAERSFDFANDPNSSPSLANTEIGRNYHEHQVGLSIQASKALGSSRWSLGGRFDVSQPMRLGNEAVVFSQFATALGLQLSVRPMKRVPVWIVASSTIDLNRRYSVDVQSILPAREWTNGLGLRWVW